jgi:2-phospho-L-lactate guanylyltransferase
MILIPIKNLAHSKQRLAGVLSQNVRTKLAKAMLLDILEVLSAWQKRPEVSIVTGDPFAIEVAKHFNFRVIQDSENTGETDAIAMATHICESQGAENTLVIPGDIPLIEVLELEKIVHSAPAQGSVMVPAADGRGTNAVWRSPCGLFPLRFGNDSFVPHKAAALATKKPCVVMSLPGIALDIDNPADLKQLAAAAGERHSQHLARQWSFAELPVAANE